jgi:Domain of unknown function (DUF6089)
MRKLCLVSVSLLLVLLVTDDLWAQFNRNTIKRNNKRIATYRGRKSGFGREKIYNAVGVSISALNYYGDIAPLPKKLSTDISFTRPAIGLSFAHRFGPRYTVQAQFMYGSLSASDTKSASQSDEDGKFRYLRNLSFRNRIKEFSLVAYFDLFENQSTYISRVPWTPYVYVGIAGLISNPQAQAPQTDLTGAPLAEAGKWVDLRPLQTEGKSYSAFQAAIPFGIGARIRLNEVFDLWADIGFRYTFTDRLDDLSGTYSSMVGKSPLAQAMAYRTNEITGPPPNDNVTGIPLQGVPGVNVKPGYGNPGDQRGTSGNKDIYMVTSIRLTYILGATFHRAKFR